MMWEPVRWGNAGRGVRRLFTAGGAKVGTVEELEGLEPKAVLVVGGPEPFQSLDYEEYAKPPEPEDRDRDRRQPEPVNYRSLHLLLSTRKR